MTRPLYKTAADQPTTRGTEGNAGLWYEKFCNRWRVTGSSWSMAADDAGNSPKLDWIRSLAGGTGVGTREQLEDFASRWIRLVEGPGGQFAVFVTESRFATGLGRSHPVENGFAWHPTLGAPYLPGSSIKGLVRSWAREGAEPQPDPAALARTLGDRGKSGGVSFLDAVPIEPVRLEADVITPHYAGWCENDPPGDWRSPTPIPFLVTAVGTRFLFGVVPCASLQSQDLQAVFGWLDSALKWSGAGAKTAVGYGRMVQHNEATEQLTEGVRRQQEQLEAQRREAERQAGLDPFDRELEDVARADAGVAPYLAWLRAVEDGRWREQTDFERRVLERVRAEMEKAGKWKPSSSKKRPDKDKAHQRTLRVMQLLAQEGNG